MHGIYWAFIPNFLEDIRQVDIQEEDIYRNFWDPYHSDQANMFFENLGSSFIKIQIKNQKICKFNKVNINLAEIIMKKAFKDGLLFQQNIDEVKI